MKKMKKSFVLFTFLLVLILFGCTSTEVEKLNPSEIEYTEITSNDYFNADRDKLNANGKGYKVTDVYIERARASSDETELLFQIQATSGIVSLRASQEVYATDFAKRISEVDTTWGDRMDYLIANNNKYNGHFTFYLYVKREGDSWDGYTTKVIVYNIEGVPSQEQIDADKAEETRLKAEKEAAQAKAKAEKKAKIDAKGKEIAQGYVYHGIEEDAKSTKLFVNGALEEGHAYYISGFVVKYGGSMAKIEYGDGFLYSSQSSAVYVDYVSQKVKAEVVEAGVTNLFGQTIELPLKVVIAGGKGYSKTPVVLGVITEE